MKNRSNVTEVATRGDGEVTGLGVVETNDGTMLPDALDVLLETQDDVAIVKTIKMGDPQNGGVPAYVGLIHRRGEDVETTIPIQVMEDGKMVTKDQPGLLPTWTVQPVRLKVDPENPKKLVWTPIPKVTVVLICPHALHTGLERIHGQAEATKTVAMFAARWNGKRSIKGGTRTINDFDIVEHFEAKPEAPKALPAADAAA